MKMELRVRSLIWEVSIFMVGGGEIEIKFLVFTDPEHPPAFRVLCPV